MSRHNVTYKPGGSITKPLDIALKMQRVVPVEEVPECPECTPGVCESPPLVGVWVDQFGWPMVDEVGAQTNIYVQVSRLSDWCFDPGNCFTTLSGFFLYVARMVNEDFISAGVAAPLFIDESLCWWEALWSGSGDSPTLSLSGSSIAVAYNEFIGSGTLTITPQYDGVSMPVLTLTVEATVNNNCA